MTNECKDAFYSQEVPNPYITVRGIRVQPTFSGNKCHHNTLIVG